MNKKCPICEKEIENYIEIYTDKPFTANALDAMTGLNAWGVYSSEKLIVCQNETYVHWSWPDGTGERLVKMLGELDVEAISKIKHHIQEQSHECEEEGCEDEGVACFLSFVDIDAAFYCWDHAKKHGYCPCCGYFYAGIESYRLIFHHRVYVWIVPK